MSYDQARAERNRRFLAALREKRRLNFPASGWPNWSVEEFEEARRELDDTISDLTLSGIALHVEEKPDGTLEVRELASLN